ncbi:MAG: UDP-N-acetylmuramate dehydrogenase [Rudaea sp.]
MSTGATGIVSEPGYTIVENAPLQGRNTFRVAAKADMLVDIHDASALPIIAGYASIRNTPPLVLGGGSNILITRDWPGVVMSLSTSGIRILEKNDDGTLIRVEAGENWHDVVSWTLAHGFVGLENLALIPGTTGAAPIQNIGAYGVEVREFVRTVEAFEWRSASLVRLSPSDCQFAYRDSLFKRDPARYLVTAVEFSLPRARELRLDYAGVRDELKAMNVDIPTAPLVAEAVCRLRTRKLPNPALIGNAGSFFKNPVVDAQHASEVLRDHPSLPMWIAGDARKLSAAWMIEACGLKGLREGDAGVSTQHSLVLVNYGGATGAQIWALAERVRGAVLERFGVAIEPEPIVI